MHPNGIDTIYSSYVRNTAASSSTTMIVPSSSPTVNADGDNHGEMVEKKTNDDADHDHSLDIQKRKQPFYHYKSVGHPHTPLCHLHQQKFAESVASSNTSTTIPIPFSPGFSARHYASSRFPDTPSNSSMPTPMPTVKSPASISSIAAVVPPTTGTSPKKKVKRWIVAALMILVGLLIALTFILIGLGKAFSQSLHTATASSSLTEPSLSLTSSQLTYTIMTATTTATVTNVLVSSVHHPKSTVK